MSLAERVAELGKGRFATVECWKLTDKRLVAIKSFCTDNSETTDRETQILKSVGSGCSYVATVADSNIKIHNSTPCIAMDAYLGGSLTKHIQQCRGSGLDISVVRGYECELVSALSHLEEKCCIHRDIKSSNCILDHAGHLKLCDFGSAKILAPTSMSRPATASKAERPVTEEPHHTSRTYTITGTAVIISPEMAACTVGYDHSVDNWAAGVLLYELLTGRLPAWDRASPALDTNTDNKMLTAWPSEADAEAARVAIAMDSTSTSTPAPSSSHDTTQAEAKAPSRPSTATNKPSSAVPTLVYQEQIRTAAERAWFIKSVDPNFGQTGNTTKTAANNDLNAILGNFSFTPKKSKEQILREHACELVRVLLTVCPARRLTRLRESTSKSASAASGPYKPTSWSAALRDHPFFDGVEWVRVDAGLSPPPNEHFDRRLGCMELLSEFDSASDELTDAQQALFEGF